MLTDYAYAGELCVHYLTKEAIAVALFNEIQINEESRATLDSLHETLMNKTQPVEDINSSLGHWKAGSNQPPASDIWSHG